MNKKILALLAAPVFALTASADRATLDSTKTQVALPMSTPPVIDGIIDTAGGESWIEAGGTSSSAGSNWRVTVNDLLEDYLQGGIVSTGNPDDAPFDNEDLSYQVWVGYDSNNLYVAVRVSDFDNFNDSAAANSANGSTWLDDSVEVFVDGDNSNFPTRDTTGTNPDIVNSGGQYVITTNNAYREAEAGNPGYGPDAAWYARTELTDVGYEAEFRISLSELGNPQPGDIIGFTVAVNDDDDGGDLDRQVLWIGETHVEATYGNLVLGPRTYTAPKVTAAPTVDGTINASEYPGAAEISLNVHTGTYDLESGDDDWAETDHAFSAWVVHDNDNVYIAVDVVDDMIVTDSADAGTDDGSTWIDDSVEIFFDGDVSRALGGSQTAFEGQYVFTANGARRDAEAQNPLFGAADDWFAATTTTSAGYQVEYRVSKFAILEPQENTPIGFNIALNDDDGADRKAQLQWQGRAHFEISYGHLILSPSGGTPVGSWELY